MHALEMYHFQWLMVGLHSELSPLQVGVEPYTSKYDSKYLSFYLAQLLQIAHPGHVTGVLLTLELSLAIHNVSLITGCWPVAFPVWYLCAICTPFRTIFSPFSLSFGSERTRFHSYLLSASCFNCFCND